MKCGVKFCGGCNPRFERGAAYRDIKSSIDKIEFDYANEDEIYDILLVIGGCPSCCASYEQYNVRKNIYKFWDIAQIEDIKKKLNEL